MRHSQPDRLASVEAAIDDIRRTLEVQFRRMADIQADLDRILAPQRRRAATMADQPRRDAEPVGPDVADDQGPLSDETIRRRAYEIYERRGAADGRDRDDWLEAEQDLRRLR